MGAPALNEAPSHSWGDPLHSAPLAWVTPGRLLPESSRMLSVSVEPVLRPFLVLPSVLQDRPPVYPQEQEQGLWLGGHYLVTQQIAWGCQG